MNQTQWIRLHRCFLSLLVGAILSAQIHHHMGIAIASAVTDPPQSEAENCAARIEGQWTWVDGLGQNKTDAELRTIFKQHKTWLETARKEGKQADVSGTKLKGADLRQVNLSEANLANSDLSYADLTRAILNKTTLRETILQCTRLNETYLQEADLTKTDLARTLISSNTQFDGAILVGASLKGASLRGGRFTGANLGGSDLTSANLTEAEFVGADLRNANLRGAILIDTKLNAAHLEGADLFGATYEARTDPTPKSIAYAKHIENMTHGSNPESLARLRGSFKETGFRDQERKITFALKSRQAELLWETCENAKGNCFEYFVNRYLFDVTSQYGMNPGRVLVIILSIFGVSTVLYFALMHFSHDSGLSIIVPADRDRSNQPLWLLADLSKEGQQIQEGGFTTKKGYAVKPRELHQYKKLDYCREWLRRERVLLWVSFVFSLMSMFNIKFRDVDFGRWLRQLTTKEYDIKAVGWARTVSGVQALLSVYFIALLLVTYFGRPFA
jgi:uncharacterized protein YjbI with pentapeptide repeats